MQKLDAVKLTDEITTGIVWIKEPTKITQVKSSLTSWQIGIYTFFLAYLYFITRTHDKCLKVSNAESL